jgi:beta-glucosidase
MGWEVAPAGLIDALRMASEALPGIPLSVTENGAAVHEENDLDGVHDPARIDYLRAHLDALREARELGMPIRAYFVWSLMDNIEWALGWTRRFGLVRVDPAQLERRVKDSALWLRASLAQRPSVP